MPLVTVYVKTKVESELRVELVHHVLPEAVAAALHVEANAGAHLDAGDITVILLEPSAIPGCVARLTHDIVVTIDANDFPERRLLLESAAASIFDKVQAVVEPSHTIGVWTGMKRAAWVEG